MDMSGNRIDWKSLSPEKQARISEALGIGKPYTYPHGKELEENWKRFFEEVQERVLAKNQGDKEATRDIFDEMARLIRQSSTLRNRYAALEEAENRHRKLNQMQRPGPNTMQRPGFTREQ